MTGKGYEYRYRAPRNTPEERGGTPPVYSRTIDNEYAMVIERNAVITLRDGVKIYADVFRPADERPVPPIIAWTPYGKHVPFDPKRFLNAGVKEGDTSKYTAFEAPDPTFWMPQRLRGRRRRHARHLVFGRHRAFSRAGRSAGFLRSRSNGPARSRGATARSACPAFPISRNCSGASPNSIRRILPRSIRGKAGPTAIARSRPMAAFPIPTSGRRCGTAGAPARPRSKISRPRPKNIRCSTISGNSKAADFSKITAPAFVVASWTDQGLHTRGTFEGFKHIASKAKMSDRARPEEMGALLRAGKHAQAARVLRPLSSRASTTT